MEELGAAGGPHCPPTGANSTTTEPRATPMRRGPGRKKVNQACVYCQRSHMTCDRGRPCQRCVKRRIGHLCHDSPASFTSTFFASTTSMATRATGRGRTSRATPKDRDPTRAGGQEKEEKPDTMEKSSQASPTSPLKITEAAQILFSLHDQIDLIIRQHNPRPDVFESRPFDEKQSYQSLIQFFDDQYWRLSL